MNELVVKSVSLAYSSFEDRLQMHCVVGGKYHELWMTQRMWQQLMPKLISWLKKSGGARSAHLVGLTMKKKLPSSGEVPDVDKSDSSQAIGSAALGSDASAAEAAQPLPPSSHVWICSIANITMNDARIRISIGSEKSSLTYIFSMTVLEASYFLLAHKRVSIQAAWPFDWPEWLVLEEDLATDCYTKLLH